MWKTTRVPRRATRLAACLVLSATGIIAQVLTRAESPSPRQASAPPAAGPVRAHVRLEALLTSPGGATGFHRLEARRTLAPSAESTAYFGAGGTEAPDLCDRVSFSEDPPSTPTYYQWRLVMRVLDVSDARTTVAVNWSRWRAGSEDGSDSRTVTLEPGDRHVLDFVAAPQGPPKACVSLMLQVAADPVPQDDPQPMLAYDVWLLHDGGKGRQWSHQRVYGRSTQAVQYSLPPLSWSTDGVPLQAPGQAAVRLGVRGSVRGTLNVAGFVDVSATARRTLNWHDQSSGEGGRQDYRARLDESVAIQLPDPTATVVVPGAQRPAAVARGIEFQEGQAVIHFGQFFAGSRTSLVIVVSKVPETDR
jgi:hypothetical protein